MLFKAATTRRFTVPASPEAVAGYFSCNQALLAELVPGGSVADRGKGVYRVALGAFAILGLRIRPELDVAFDNHPGRTLMRTLRVQILDGPSGLELAIRFDGEAVFEDHPAGCRIVCAARAEVTAVLGGAGAMVGNWLDGAGSALLATAMDVTAARFERLMIDHFALEQLAAA